MGEQRSLRKVAALDLCVEKGGSNGYDVSERTCANGGGYEKNRYLSPLQTKVTKGKLDPGVGETVTRHRRRILENY